MPNAEKIFFNKYARKLHNDSQTPVYFQPVDTFSLTFEFIFNPIEVMLNLEQNLGGERPTSALKMTRAKTAPEIEVIQKKIDQKPAGEYKISPTKSAPKIPPGIDQKISQTFSI